LRVLTYAREAEPRAAILIDETVYDVEGCASYLMGDKIPSDLLTILKSRKAGALPALYREILEQKGGGSLLPDRCFADLDRVKVCAPIQRPGKILCLGLNYRSHAEEQGAKIPDRPIIFAKGATAVIGPGDPIILPRASGKIDYEGEFAFVIGEPLKQVDEAKAEKAIFGYCCMNDVTDREAQSRERQWYRAKSMDTFAPMGPWITTGDEIASPPCLEITTKVNSQIMQSGSTTDLIFGPVEIITFLTSSITLEPGDIISTGTPSGVGVFREPQVFLKDGDVVEITIEGIGDLGALRGNVRAPHPTHPLYSCLCEPVGSLERWDVLFTGRDQYF
jgi:2,4-diketo-3-deoxy-L-fuconate hydrolase